MTCLSVALEEIKELRKQLSNKDQDIIPVSSAIPKIQIPVLDTTTTPSQSTSTTPHLAYPSPVALSSLFKIHSPELSLSPTPLGDSLSTPWTSPYPTDLGSVTPSMRGELKGMGWEEFSNTTPLPSVNS
eukprot:sb/3475228/